MTPAVTCRVAIGQEDLDACFAVRKEVFVAEQGVPEDLEYDEYDGGAVHVLAVRSGEGAPLGTGRLLLGDAAVVKNGDPDPGVGALGRLAVLAAARGLGVGARLVAAIEDAARERGLHAVDLHAQTHALGFYERLGYEAYGAEFLDAGIPHLAMRKPLR